MQKIPAAFRRELILHVISKSSESNEFSRKAGGSQEIILRSSDFMWIILYSPALPTVAFCIKGQFLLCTDHKKHGCLKALDLKCTTKYIYIIYMNF